MGEYTSYYLYQKYEKRGNQDWIPCYPSVYSVSGDSENPMPLVVRKEEDIECGAHPCEEIVRWSEIPITQDYICDDCEVGYQYRWVQCSPSAYTYYGDYQYNVLCEEISEDNGQTWSATTKTKPSSASTRVADKKVKVIFDNGDTFAISCGSEDGVWESFFTDGHFYLPQDVPNHTTNLYYDKFENYAIYDGTFKNVNKLVFGDCVFEIGTKYRGYGPFYEDIAESGQRLSGTPHDLSYAIWEWNIKELVLPSALRWIGGQVFEFAKLRTLTLPSTVESIGYVRNWDYLEKRYNDWIYSDYIDESYSGAFAFNKSLINVNLNEGLKSIGSCDFMGCTALEKIEIPSTVEKMDKNIFSGCTNLKQVIFKSETPPETMCNQDARFTVECDTHNGFSANSDTYVYVPCGSKSAYTEWISDLPDEKIVEYGGSCPNIPPIDDMYRAIASYKIGNNTYSIHRGLNSDTSVFSADTNTFSEWADAFYDADELILGEYCWPVWTMDSQQYISGTNISGFYNKLTINSTNRLVKLSGNTKEMVVGMQGGFIENSFNDNVYIERFVFESGNTNVVDLSYSFSGCNSITSVTINGLASFRGSAFASCENLEDVYINYDESVLVARPRTDVTDIEKYKPFGNCHPNLKIHVPCELYELYLADSYWSGFTIVRDSTDCTPIDPSYDEQIFEITKQEWDYRRSGSTRWYDSRGDSVDGYYKSYRTINDDSEITFNVMNEAIRLDCGEKIPIVYKDGVEVTLTSAGGYPEKYYYKDDMRGDYGVVHTFKIVCVNTSGYNEITIKYQTE